MKRNIFIVLSLLFFIVQGIGINKQKSLEQLELEYSEAQERFDNTYKSGANIHKRRMKNLKKASIVANNYSSTLLKLETMVCQHSTPINPHLVELGRLLNNIRLEIQELYSDKNFAGNKEIASLFKNILHEDEAALKEAKLALQKYKKNFPD